MTSNSMGTIQSSSEQLKLSWVNVGFFGTIHALALLAPWFFSWSALGVMIVLHWLFGSIGICLGYHRLLTHRSLQVPKWLEYTLATIGALALQGGPTFWVAGHRQHHLHTEDRDKDPYAASRGFWWSHMLTIAYLLTVAYKFLNGWSIPWLRLEHWLYRGGQSFGLRDTASITCIQRIEIKIPMLLVGASGGVICCGLCILALSSLNALHIISMLPIYRAILITNG